MMDLIVLDPERRSLRERFLSVQATTEEIVAPLSSEDAILSVTKETSPPKWHLGHTAWFFAKFILEPYLGTEVSPEFDYIFNSYYKGIGSHIPKEKRAVLSRPGLPEILEWRREIRNRVLEILEGISPEQSSALLRVLELGINHEEQHQELLFMDIKRNFFENPLRPRYRSRYLHTATLVPTPDWVNVPSGLTTIGVPVGTRGFFYDNEGDAHKSWVDSFMLMSHPVTNGEFLAFVEDGGYRDPRFWLSDGWDTLLREGWQNPLYWENRDGDWWSFTLWGMVPLDLSAPVAHLSYYEAEAYARYRGARLPTEIEWEVAGKLVPVAGQFLETGIPEPQSPEEGEPFSGIHGSLWEWTRSSYLPYPRYESFSGGLAEYNGKFMVNQMVLRGGSAVTPRNHYRPTYRNFYYPADRWQFGGVRLAKDLA